MTTDDETPALTVEEAARRLAEAREAVRDAQATLHAATRVHDRAQGQHAEGRDLAVLALQGNAVAMRRLDEEVRAMHPGIVGYLPVPDSNDDPGWFRRDMEDLGLRIDVPTGAEADYVSGLATALREFVRRYEPKINSPKARSGQQGRAYVETRAGTLRYGTSVTREATLVPLPTIADADRPPPDERYRTLEEALMALPELVFLAALSGRSNHHFRNA